MIVKYEHIIAHLVVRGCVAELHWCLHMHDEELSSLLQIESRGLDGHGVRKKQLSGAHLDDAPKVA